MPAEVESAKLDWEEGFHRFEAELRDPVRAERVRTQFEVLREELRKRVGSTFTIAELAAEYSHADTWAREVMSRRAPAPDWPRTLTVVEGAAFHLYSRGAVDYEP